MGTQFSSRVRGASGERLRSRIGGLTKARAARQPGLGRAVLEGTLAEAATHHFFEDFGGSPLFVQVLAWLKGLHTDAVYHGFENKMREYNLGESGNAIVTLTHALKALLVTDEARKKDPFRVAVRDAASSVLAAVATKPSDSGPDRTDVQRFSSQLRRMDTRELVEFYVKSFVSNLVSAMLHNADPNLTAISGEARNAAESAAARLGRRVVSRVQEGGMLADDERIREILSEELRSHAEAAAHVPD